MELIIGEKYRFSWSGRQRATLVAVEDSGLLVVLYRGKLYDAAPCQIVEEAKA